MDILSARKKAAERARAEKKKEPEAAPAPQPADAGREPAAEPSAPAVSAEAGSPAPGPVAAAPEAPAAPGGDEEAAAPELELLSFRLGDEEYAVPVESVKEVLKNRELTMVPNAPEYVLGVTALRGPILPVVDLCRRLGLPPGRRDEKSRIIVVSLGDEDAGIVVDRVTGVVRVPADSLRPAPETVERGAEFLRGIVRKNDRMYILLDLEKAAGG